MKNRYRTHTCAALGLGDVGQTVKLSGWVYRKRDHGGVLFFDLRDHHGITQVVFTRSSPTLALAEGIHLQSVISIEGRVVARTPENINPNLPTGTIEVEIDKLELLMRSELLPFPIADATTEVPEETRLTYRFLDLRKEKLHQNIVLRSQVISSLRRRMTEQGFLELQTPILTSTSPEGARDFLVPSRVHPGKFYALPQAPQQFKQLLMVAGFDRYFQIAPCFRDEDARADRSPGEFYQLDFEMSFVEQDDVFAAIEPVLHGAFAEFSKHAVTQPPFPRIAYRDALAEYGTDKPDLRNPLKFVDVTTIFTGSSFALFANAVASGHVVRAVAAKGAASKSRSFFDKVVELGRGAGLGGVAYLTVGKNPKGPLAKYLDAEVQARLKAATSAEDGDVLFFVTEQAHKLLKPIHELRCHLGRELGVIEKDAFRFVWVVDFPFYERDEETGKTDFSHNPFSMPQGGLEALNTRDPLSILAYQFDIVCNGIELSSGAIRNHDPEIMLRAFAIAGYDKEHVEQKFGGLLNAFRYGAPPHGGAAPGIDRMVMLLAGEANIREVIAFPMTQKAEDLLMGAPSIPTPKQLEELHIRVALPLANKKNAP